MRKVIVLTFMTLDGVMQAPGGPDEDISGGFKFGGWIVPYSDEVMGNVMAKQMKQPFSLLLGRKTYDIFASYWPEHENNWPRINAVIKYVASHNQTLRLDWENSVLLAGSVAGEVKKLKEQDGPNLHVYGSSTLVQTLLKNDLVDELWLKIFPITLGKGKHLFAEGATPASFALIDSQVSPKGVIIASYKRVGDVQVGSFV
jgi:dihydrofolate reductase